MHAVRRLRGLAVVAELVTLYHGTLRIDESDMGGARLELTLPLKVIATS